MSEHILEQSSCINDSVKRNKGETVSTASLSKNTFKFLKRKLQAAFNFMVELAEEVNKVRAESERYSRTRW